MSRGRDPAHTVASYTPLPLCEGGNRSKLIPQVRFLQSLYLSFPHPALHRDGPQPAARGMPAAVARHGGCGGAGAGRLDERALAREVGGGTLRRNTVEALHRKASYADCSTKGL